MAIGNLHDYVTSGWTRPLMVSLTIENVLGMASKVSVYK